MVALQVVALELGSLLKGKLVLERDEGPINTYQRPIEHLRPDFLGPGLLGTEGFSGNLRG